MNLKVLLQCAMDSYIKNSTKKARPHEGQESGFVLKNMLPDSGANGCQITMNGDKLVCPVNTDAVKKYFVKMKSSISRKH